VSAQHHVDPRPVLLPSPGHCQAGLSVSWIPHVSLSPSRVETVTHPTRYRARYHSKPVPFLCFSLRCSLVKLRTHPAPRCSVQASVSCLSPRLRAVGKPYCHRAVTSPYCTGQSLSSPLHHHDAGAKHLATTPHAAPLLPPPLLAPHAAPSSLQLPSPASRRHRALARPCALHGHHQPPCPAHFLTTDVRTKMPSASPPRQLLLIAASLRSAPACARSHYLSTAMHCTPCSSHPIPLTPCTGQ
jgi:hypothetical protein